MTALQLSAELVLLLLLAATLLVGGIGWKLWQTFSPKSRRERAYRRARWALAEGDWRTARREIALLRKWKIDSAEWIGRLNHLESECLRQEALARLETEDEEGALGLLEQAGVRLGVSWDKARTEVASALHAHTHRLLAAGKGHAAVDVANRILKIRADDAATVRFVAETYVKACHRSIVIAEPTWQNLLESLIRVGLVDRVTLSVIDQVLASSPTKLSLAAICLYAWTAITLGERGQHDLEILSRVFMSREEAMSYFQARSWDWKRVERGFLERWLEIHTGFPAGFDPEHEQRIENEWIEEITRQQRSGRHADAERLTQLLARLAPGNIKALDHQARLAWKRGDVAAAIEGIRRWLEIRPDDPLAWLRLAVLGHRSGQTATALHHLREAFTRADDKFKPTVALTAARCSLQSGDERTALSWLDECLRLDPTHSTAFPLAIALRWKHGNRDHLARLAQLRPKSDESALFAAAVAFWTCGELATARSYLERLFDSPWSADAHHLAAMIEQDSNRPQNAIAHLEEVIKHSGDRTAHHARAWLGRDEAIRGRARAAVRYWLEIPDSLQEEWGLTSVLPSWLLRAGIEAIEQRDFMTARQLLRQAEGRGASDSRLTRLVEWAAIGEAAQRLARGEPLDSTEIKPLLEQAAHSELRESPPARLVFWRLAQQGVLGGDLRPGFNENSSEVRAIREEQAARAVRDGRWLDAEMIYVSILQDDPDSVATRWNLFWSRLSMGKTDAAWLVWDETSKGRLSADKRRVLERLWSLMTEPPSVDSPISRLTDEEANELIRAIRWVGRLPFATQALRLMRQHRPLSESVREAWKATALREAWQHFRRHKWLSCEKCLREMVEEQPWSAGLNLLGVVLAIQRDFGGAVRQFREALRQIPDDPRIHQNLALTLTWAQDPAEAELHWGRYLGLFSHELPSPQTITHYHRALRFEVLNQRAAAASSRQQDKLARAYWSEAAALCPDDADLLERLFQVQRQTRDLDGARQTLARLRSLRPGEPRYALEELACREVHTVEDFEQWLDHLGRLIRDPALKPTFKESAASRGLDHLELCVTHLHQFAHDIRADLSRLPVKSAGWWSARRKLRRVSHDLLWLKDVARYLHPWVNHEASRQRLAWLHDLVGRSVEQCHAWLERGPNEARLGCFV